MPGPKTPVLAGDRWTVQVSSRTYNQVCLNRFKIHIDSIPAAAAERFVEDIALQMETAPSGLIADIQACMASSAAIDGTWWKRQGVGVPPALWVPLSAGPIVGARAGAAMPSQVAFTINYNTVTSGPAGRGHVNLPAPLQADMHTDGYFTTGLMTAADNLCDILTSLGVIWGTGTDGVYHFVLPTTTVQGSLILATASRTPGTQRQRKMDRGI